MDDFYGDKFRWFIGIVKQVANDRSRVRVRIFGVHPVEDLERVSNNDLPWATVLYPTTGAQTSGGNLSHNLVAGTWVFGFFVDNIDSQQPVIVGVINGGQGSVNNSSGTVGTNSDQSSSPSSSSVTNSVDDTIAPTQLTGTDNASKTYNYFWERITKEGAASGDKKIICAAIVGCLQIESGDNINPQAYNPNDLGETSAGIAQWRGGKYDRLTPMLVFCGFNSIPPKGSFPPLDQQLDYVWHEFHSSEKSAYHKILAATNLEDAVIGMGLFERDASYVKMNGSWQIDTSSSYYIKKLNKAHSALSTYTYTGDAV